MQLHKLHNNVALHCSFSITIHGNDVIVTCIWFPLVVVVKNIHAVSMQVGAYGKACQPTHKECSYMELLPMQCN